MAMNTPVAFLNGQWIPQSAAAVAVGDAGFVQGSAIAEQLRTFAGKIFHLEQHLDRLFHSLDTIGLDAGMTPAQIADVARQLIAKNHPMLAPGDDLGLSIFVTPGPYPAYSPPGPVQPTVCLHTYALPFRLWADKYREGQTLVTTSIQQVPPHCWPSTLKCRSRMHYHLADKQAAAIDPRARALLLDADGFVTEASTANLLIYNAAEGFVSPPSTKILHGISLATVAELAHQFGTPAIERDLSTDDVAMADEVLLASTPLCLLPVTQFNGRPIGSGQPGKMFHRLMSAWSAMAGVDIIAQAIQFKNRA